MIPRYRQVHFLTVLPNYGLAIMTTYLPQCTSDNHHFVCSTTVPVHTCAPGSTIEAGAILSQTTASCDNIQLNTRWCHASFAYEITKKLRVSYFLSDFFPYRIAGTLSSGELGMDNEKRGTGSLRSGCLGNAHTIIRSENLLTARGRKTSNETRITSFPTIFHQTICYFAFIIDDLKMTFNWVELQWIGLNHRYYKMEEDWYVLFSQWECRDFEAGGKLTSLVPWVSGGALGI